MLNEDAKKLKKQKTDEKIKQQEESNDDFIPSKKPKIEFEKFKKHLKEFDNRYPSYDLLRTYMLMNFRTKIEKGVVENVISGKGVEIGHCANLEEYFFNYAKPLIIERLQSSDNKIIKKYLTRIKNVEFKWDDDWSKLQENAIEAQKYLQVGSLEVMAELLKQDKVCQEYKPKKIVYSKKLTQELQGKLDEYIKKIEQGKDESYKITLSNNSNYINFDKIEFNNKQFKILNDYYQNDCKDEYTKNKLKQFTDCNLAFAEKFAINYYTGEGYSDYKKCYNVESFDVQDCLLNCLAVSGINQLPPSIEEFSCRGEQYGSYERISGIMGSSCETSGHKFFFVGGQSGRCELNNIHSIIQNNNLGKDISKLSCTAEEGELVFAPNLNIHTICSDEFIHGDKKYEIRLVSIHEPTIEWI